MLKKDDIKREMFLYAHRDAVFKLAVLYARKYFLETDDIFQEGMLGVLTAFDTYERTKGTPELNRIARALANRFMYRYVKKEIKERHLCVLKSESMLEGRI